MSSEINVNISKILNWTLTHNNTKLQIAFHTLKSHSYLAHKTVVGYYNMQTMILNTSFKINYSRSDHIIICKFTDIHDANNQVIIGEIQIDLNTLMDRNILFLPFDDHDKVLQVKIYQSPKEKPLQSHLEDEESQNQRQSFLQERYNFLDKINEHEAHLKKKFSEKVYNLLKEVKNKNYEKIDHRQGQSHAQGDSKHRKNELQFMNRLADNKKKSQSKYDMNLNVGIEKKTRLSPIKNRYEDLLINSMQHNKHDYDYSAQTSKRQTDIVTKNELKQIQQQIKTMRLDIKGANTEIGYNGKNAFTLLNKMNDY